MSPVLSSNRAQLGGFVCLRSLLLIPLRAMLWAECRRSVLQLSTAQVSPVESFWVYMLSGLHPFTFPSAFEEREPHG